MSFFSPLAVLGTIADAMPAMPGMDHGADTTQAAIFDGLVVSRWLHFSCVFVLFGASLFWLGTGRHLGVPVPAARRATLRLLRAAAPLALLSAAAWLAGMIANMTGGFAPAVAPDNLRLFFFETSFGAVWALRLALLILAVAAAWGPVKGESRLAILAAAGALLLVSQAWLGHSAEGGTDARGLLMILVYCLHVAAAGFWVGGLPPLFFAIAEIKKAATSGAARETHMILRRFSSGAAVAVSLMILSGAGTAWFRTAGSLGILAHTSYGAVLLLKFILAAAMLLLAGYNRFYGMPAIAHAPAQDKRQRGPWILTSIGVETGLGLLVVAAAAILGITPPPE